MPLEQTHKVNQLIKEAHRRGDIPNIAHTKSFEQKPTSPGALSWRGEAVSLPKQHVPEGFEAAETVPEWADVPGRERWDRRVNRVRAADLKHALRIKGTNHFFTSDVPLTKAQLEGVLADYQTALDAIGHKFPYGVNMHLPVGKNGKIPRKARGWCWPIPGMRTFFLKSGLAKNADEETYRVDQDLYEATQRLTNEKMPADKRPTIHSWSMPAHRKKTGRAYTMVHEMGHLLDQENGHTGGPVGAMFGVDNPKWRGVWTRNRLNLSAYGRSEPVEGYAEAAAQYFLGGKGTNEAADDYAKTFGW